MAESFLFSIAESLIAKLASSAYEEASRVIGVYHDLHEFKNTLSYVKAVLLDADQKKEHNHELQEWLRQIHHFCSDAENLLDEFECHTLRKQVVKAYGTAKTKVGHFFSTSNPLVFRYRMAKQIKEFRKRLDKVAADRDKFGLQIIDVDPRVVHTRELTYSTVNDSDVIGREHDKELIIQSLLQQNPCGDDNNLSVIPIVGMGGLGKTTLAKFVYNDKRIDESFPLKMWVCISGDFDIKQLIIKIINSASTDALAHQLNLKYLDMEQLQNHLRNKLVDQKFLLVLDDVWNEDRGKWVELRNLIQVGAEGSKILVTTRSQFIASMMGTIPSHMLGGLSLEDSLFLLKKWAFKEGEEEKYPHLVEVYGRGIVGKCGGVPLAIRTIGSLLFLKVEINEWEAIRDSEIWNLPQKNDDILPALKLSYDQMPSHLRQCFAIFSLYPKDYEFDSFEVRWLWEALGLLPSPNKNKTLVDVAKQYLYELMSRSFLQDFVNFGTLYTFQIHDLVHDLALYVAKDQCLMVNPPIQNIHENVQHLSFVGNNLLDKAFTPNSLGVRTILFPIEGEGASSEAFMNLCMSRYIYLRILDLSDSTYETLPRSIGKLRHLRYLCLGRNKKIKRVPNSICKLQNLQLLDLSGCTDLETLPKGLRNLISLQNLSITTKQSTLPENDIANLSSLEFLSIESCENLEFLFVGIKLPTLKTLSVSNCGSLKSLPIDINHFPQLEVLMLEDCVNFELSKGHDDQNSNLRLKVIGLHSLPQLVTLPRWLEESANTLQSLLIAYCENLEVPPEWLSTLSSLKTFSLVDCPKLKSLPNDFHHLTALGYLRIEDCPELCRKCQPQVGEYWPKISHIKQIVIDEPEDAKEELVQEEEELEEEQEIDQSNNNPDKC